MSSPTLEYFWVKLTDSKTVIPQFDFRTGKENLWNDNTEALKKVSLVPFTVDLAEKVIKNGIAAIASTNPTFEFVVKPGETVEAGRDNNITYFDYFRCLVCGKEFMHTDSSKFAECPKCGAMDEWFCSRCHEYKTDFKVTNKGQVQCKECDIPVGLDRKRHLRRDSAVSHSCDYFIRSKDRKLIVREDGKVIFE